MAQLVGCTVIIFDLKREGASSQRFFGTSMQSIPKFSVVIPLYNKRRYIRRTVDSVLFQSMQNFELIVVDDGSTDGSLDALADVDDSRLNIIQQANQGEGAARNAGIAVAAAPWIALIDADDAWLPEHLAELSRVADAFPDAGLISTSNVEAFGRQVPQFPVTKVPAKIEMVDYFWAASKRVGIINSSSAAVRRTIFGILGGFNAARAGADLEFWARVALHYPVAVSNKTTSVYFRDTGGVMAQMGDLRRRNPARTIENLSQLSSSVATVMAHAQTDPSILQSPSVVAYINSRIESGIKGALFHGDTDNARRLSKMLLRPASLKVRLYARATYLPSNLVRLLLLIHRRVKHATTQKLHPPRG
jgi:glycosyltransferase involved in cell wall biosynthesis